MIRSYNDVDISVCYKRSDTMKKAAKFVARCSLFELNETRVESERDVHTFRSE